MNFMYSPTVAYRPWPPMSMGGGSGSASTGSGVSLPSAARSWMVTRRLRMDSVMPKPMSFMPSGPKIRSAIIAPRRWPRCCSTMRPSQSMLGP